MTIAQHEPLATRNTFRVGGEASLYVPIFDITDLKEGMEYRRAENLPFFVLGEGSNVLIDDAGFTGVVFHMQSKGVSWDERGDSALIVAEAGEHWDDIVRSSVEKGYGGLENLSGIPGTVGATPIQNIGAYGTEIADAVEWVEGFDINTMETRVFTPRDCHFGYRDSFFKTPAGKKYIITRVCYRVSKRAVPQLSYKDLTERFQDAHPSVREVREEVLAIRSRKFPDLSLYGCAGSFFKNPILDSEQCSTLKGILPALPAYPMDSGRVKVPAAYLIEHAGWKGKCDGNVCTYKNQSLVLVNTGNATATEIKNFSEKIIADIVEKFSVQLEPEVQMIKSV